MRITTQLCTAVPVGCTASRPAQPRPTRALLAIVSILKPLRPLPGCASCRLFLTPGPGPREPVGITEAGDEPRICPCPGAGRPTPLSGFPGLPAAHRRWPTWNFLARSTSLGTLRITGLAERRLECKKKMRARTPVNRLRPGRRNPTSACLRDHRGERRGNSKPRRRKSQSLNGQRRELARELLARRHPDDYHRIGIGAGGVSRQTTGAAATGSTGSACTALLMAAPRVLRSRSRDSETSAALRTLAAPGTMPGEGMCFPGCQL